MTSLPSSPPMPLHDVPEDVLTEMAAKRSGRVYVDDGDDSQIVEEPLARAARHEESGLLVAMERRGSTSSTSTMSSGISSTRQPPRVEGNQGVDMVDLLELDGGGAALVDISKRADLSQASPILGRCRGPVLATTALADQPSNFGVVIPGVYRSSYPKAEHYAFMQGLGLKTIITLVDRDFPEGYQTFIDANNIRHHVFKMKGTRTEAIPVEVMKSILRLVINRQNHPLLIHCNHGKHRTGCVVAVIRKVAGWDLTSIIDEYKSFAYPKFRECDIQYITNFQVTNLSHLPAARETPTLGLRFPMFARITFFTILVLIIWLISGSKIALTSETR